MATIDSRITPLVETLIASGADFIAIEILIAIQRGLVKVDSENELQEARKAVDLFRKGDRPREFRSTGETEVRHLSGEEQIEFAAKHVFECLERNLEMMDASLENLNKITNEVTNQELEENTKLSPVKLRWVDAEHEITREQIIEGRKQLITLHEALTAWTNSARVKGQTK